VEEDDGFQMTKTMSAPDLAAKLGVSITTIKTWSERVGIGRKNSSGVWVYSENDLQILETVQALRGEDKGFETITRRLQKEAPEAESSPPGGNFPPPAPSLENFRSMIVETLRTDNDLAEKYARAAHQIGRLEAENEGLQRQLEESRTRMALIEEPSTLHRPWWKFWSS
jgi:DNA-binding transcriptional MerR regulator